MTKTFFKKSLICSSAVVMTLYGYLYACGGGFDDWGYFYNTNFAPEAYADNSFSPLYASEDLFYDYGQNTVNQDVFREQMQADWKQYLKDAVNHTAVDYFLFGESLNDVNGLFDYYRSGIATMASKKWEKKIRLNDSKTKGFIELLYYAKQVEFASVYESEWDYDYANRKTIEDHAIPLELIYIYKNTHDKFLKTRFWFQAIKAYFYSSEREEAIAFFEETQASIPKNAMYYRALGYAAGIHYRAQRYSVANYLYSRIFDNCPELRISAAFCFHPQEQADWNATLALAKNNNERAALWALYGYYADEAEAIEQIFKIKPDSPYMEFLLTRLVNDQEMNTDKSISYDNPDDPKKGPAQTAVALVSRIADSGKNPKSYLWNIAAGYMQTLNGKYTEANKYFDKGEKQMPKTPLAGQQLRLLRLVNKLSSIDKMTAKIENDILPELNWLHSGPEYSGEETGFRNYNAKAWSKKHLSELYRRDNNPVMAELFARDPKYYHDPKNLEAMKRFLKNDKTPFEQTAVKFYDVTASDIYYYQAVKATFENSISQAIVFMSQTDSLQTKEFYGNPFTGNIKDCHDCDHARPQKRKYSVLSFLKTIQEMQAKVENSVDVYTNAMLLGNAFYNITYYGNGRTFYESNVFGYDRPFASATDIDDIITDCTVAKKYYRMALAAAKTDEHKAKCHYMLAKCERNDYYSGKYKNETSLWHYDEDKIHFLEWDGFKALKSQYSKTNFYKETLAECGYFRTYIEQSR